MFLKVYLNFQTFCAKLVFSEQQLVGVTLDNHIQIWDARSGKTSKLAQFQEMAKMNHLDLGENLFTVNY